MTIDRAFKAQAFAMLDAMSASGLGTNEIGTVLIGMAVAALREGGRTREEIHHLVDTLLNGHDRPC